MNKEISSFSDKKEQTPINQLDSEIEFMENNFENQDRLVISRQIMEEIFRPPVKNDYRQFIEDENTKVILNKNYKKEKFANYLKTEVARGKDELKHYLLPDIPGGNGDLQSIREFYDKNIFYFKSDKHFFFKVGQGELWSIPCEKHPYIIVSMSECSAIVAKNNDKIMIAHISFSLEKQIKEAINFMLTQGFQINDIHAIASTGDYQKRKTQEKSETRASTIQDYLDLGLPASNIKEFAYELENENNLGQAKMKNLTEIIVCNDGIFTYSFDLINDKYTKNGYHQTFIDNSYKNEEFIQWINILKK